jgi:hypothetical protein
MFLLAPLFGSLGKLVIGLATPCIMRLTVSVCCTVRKCFERDGRPCQASRELVRARFVGLMIMGRVGRFLESSAHVSAKGKRHVHMDPC